MRDDDTDANAPPFKAAVQARRNHVQAEDTGCTTPRQEIVGCRLR